MFEKLKKWAHLNCVLVDVEGMREWRDRVEAFVDEDERMDLVDRIRRAWKLADERDEKHLVREEWIDEYFLLALEEYGVDVRISCESSNT